MRVKISSLSKNEDFKYLLGGKKISSKYITIFYRKLAKMNPGSLNISFVTKKKLGNAVRRNRARRRMRALARLHLAPLARPGVDYVLIARHDTVSCDWQDLVTGLIKAVRYLHHKLPDRGQVSS